MSRTIILSPIAETIFGTMEVSEESITNYGYAMLGIAGADHEISDNEYEWMNTNFCDLLFIPSYIESKFRLFDFEKVDLNEIIPKIQFDTSANIKLLLVYHGLQMANADNKYHRQERKALENAAKILKVTEYQVNAIEQLTYMEKSITEMRKALFEVDYSKKSGLSDREERIRLNSWVTMNFGHRYTTYDSLVNYYNLLLTICGADGSVKESEMEWLEMTALIAGTPPEIIENLRSFNYRKASVDQLIKNIRTDTHQNLERISLYFAMNMCRADGVYAEKEQRSIQRAAKLLNIETEVVDYLENLVEMEIAADRFKLRLLR